VGGGIHAGGCISPKLKRAVASEPEGGMTEDGNKNMGGLWRDEIVPWCHPENRNGGSCKTSGRRGEGGDVPSESPGSNHKSARRQPRLKEDREKEGGGAGTGGKRNRPENGETEQLF